MIIKGSVKTLFFILKPNGMEDVYYMANYELKPAEETVEGVKTERSPKSKRREVSDKLTPKRIKNIAPDEKLSDKHYMFITHYLKSFNATRSYMKAFDCSYVTANTEGSKLLSNPRMRAEIQRIKDEAFNLSFIDLSTIIEKYKQIAFADINDFIKTHESGSYFVLDTGEHFDGTIVDEIDNGKNGVKIKLADRMEALKRLEKYYTHLSTEDQIRIKLLNNQLKKSEIEIQLLTGDDDADDTQAKINSYAEVIKGSVASAFDDEVEGDE